MYYSAAAFSGSSRLNGKSPKTFDTIVSTNLRVFFLFRFVVGCRAATPNPSPLWVRPCLRLEVNALVCFRLT